MTAPPTAPDTVRALLLPPGEEPARFIDTPTDLTTLQGLVGGYVQALRLSEEVDLFCNEEGKLERLPVNGHANRLAALLDLGLQPGDFFVGQVVLLGVLNPATGIEDGDSHPVPEELVTGWCQNAGIPLTT